MTAPQPVPAAGPSRFEWERALRTADLPWHIKSVLLLVGTYMSHNGHDARPSVPKLAEHTGLSRASIFRILADAAAAGWILNDPRPGYCTTRLPATPVPPVVDTPHETPPSPVDNSPAAAPKPHVEPAQHTNPPPVNPSYPWDGGGPTHKTHPSHRWDPTDTEQVQDSQGATLPPRTPLANPAADATGNEPPPNDHQWPTHQPQLAKQPDTAHTRANDCPTCSTVLDPDGSCFICHTPGLAYTGT